MRIKLTYKDLLHNIAAKFGLEAEVVFDGDMDILIPGGKIPIGLLKDLRGYGFKYYPPEDEFGEELHIHAPHRKEKSWFDRGWDWEVSDELGTLPSTSLGEAPYFGEGYLGPGQEFGEN